MPSLSSRTIYFQTAAATLFTLASLTIGSPVSAAIIAVDDDRV